MNELMGILETFFKISKNKSLPINHFHKYHNASLYTQIFNFILLNSIPFYLLSRAIIFFQYNSTERMKSRFCVYNDVLCYLCKWTIPMSYTVICRVLPQSRVFIIILHLITVLIKQV